MNALLELSTLMEPFPGEQPLFLSADHVPQLVVPEPYHSLLVHNHHMTIAMEDFHHSPVDVRVLDRKLEGNTCCRKILLLKRGTAEVVQFGLVRFDLSAVAPEVRQEILAERKPLGRILIEHNVLRQVDLGGMLELTIGPGLAEDFGTRLGARTYGRLATLFCNNRPAVDLLEVSAPLGYDV